MKFLLLSILFFEAMLCAEVALKKSGLEKMIEPKVSLESSYLSDAALRGYNASVAVHKNRISLNNEIFGFSYSHLAFDWENPQNLPFGDKTHSPIEQMHSLNFHANIPYYVNEKWFILTSVSAKSSFEVESSNSYGAGLFSFASYKLDDEHSFEFGAFANYHPTSTLVLPVISYSYRARQSDGLKFVLGFPRTYVGYHLNEDTLLRFGVIFSQSLSRLSDTSTIEKAGFIETKDYLGNLGVSYEVHKNFNIETDLLYSLKRDIIIYSKDADELNSYSVKPSFGLNLKLVYIF